MALEEAEAKFRMIAKTIMAHRDDDDHTARLVMKGVAG